MRAAGRLSHRRLRGSELSRDLADFVAYLAGDEGTKAIGLFAETIRRPDAFAAALGPRRRGRQAGRVPQGRALAGRGAGRARPLGRGRRLGARVLGAAAPSRRDRGERLPRAFETLELLGRTPLAARAAHRGRLGIGQRCGLPGRPRGGGRNPVQRRFDEALKARLIEAFPTTPCRRTRSTAGPSTTPRVVYPGSLALLRDTGAYDVLLAQVDLSQHRGAREEEWCSLIVARSPTPSRARTSSLPSPRSARPTRRRRSRSWRGRATWRCCAAPARACGRSRRGALAPVRRAPRRTPARAASLGDPLPAGALPEHDSCALLERYGVGFPPRARCASAGRGGGGVRAPRRAGRRQGRRARAQAGRGRRRARHRSPAEAREAAERMGGRVLVARQVARRRRGVLRHDARPATTARARRRPGRTGDRGARPRRRRAGAAGRRESARALVAEAPGSRSSRARRGAPRSPRRWSRSRAWRSIAPRSTRSTSTR